jgi:hypothetical protein
MIINVNNNNILNNNIKYVMCNIMSIYNEENDSK